MNKSRKTAKAKLAKADVKHGAVADAGQPPPLTAEQIEKDCPALVEDLGKRIAAHYDKLVKSEEKAEQHKIAISQLLTQAKGACDKDGFMAFRKRFCPKLSKSRAHELLQIASGKKSIEDVRAATAGRMKKHRAVKKAAAEQKPKPSVTVTDPDPAVIAEKHEAEYSDPPKANGKIAAKQEPKPSVTVTDQDPAVTAEKRKAEYANDDAVAEPEAEPEAEPTVAEYSDPPKANDDAVAEPEAEPTGPEPEAEPTVEEAEAEVKRLKAQRAALRTKINANMEDGTKTDPKASANALAEFNAACSTCLPQMSENDLQAAIYGFAEVVEVPAEELMPDLRQSKIDLKIAKAEVTALKRKLAGKLPPRESRAEAWGRHSAEARSSIEALISMQQEFEEAKDGQPDSLQEGPYAQKCEEICAIDLESALSTLEEAESTEVPLGFGRD
jgi:hypothetical protein